MTQELYRDLYMMVSKKVEDAQNEINYAISRLCEDDDEIDEGYTKHYIKRLREANKKKSEAEDLLNRFEYEVKDPTLETKSDDTGLKKYLISDGYMGGESALFLTNAPKDVIERIINEYDEEDANNLEVELCKSGDYSLDCLLSSGDTIDFWVKVEAIGYDFKLDMN